VFLGHLVYQPVQIQVLGREVASSQTGLDQAVLACALERFRLARGEFPETLEALAPEFLTRIPRDVLHGQPPKYRRTEAGRYVLSSPGWNGTDHGGASGKDWVW
jgi:hypothetical protein